MSQFSRTPFVDPMIKVELLKIRERVINKDRDYVAVYDGEEGVGKSVLAQQHALILDPDFTLDNIVFTSDDFVKKIKDPKTKKGSCIVLDEAFNAMNARASLSSVNRAMVALATEMRQRNLFVLICLPSFFDLDRYFALWRARALFHVYFTPTEERRYVVFDKQTKKILYLYGKKTYNYTYPKAPFPPSSFFNTYVVDETEYRLKKAMAFRKRTISNQAKTWLLQRNALIKELIYSSKYTQERINLLLVKRNIPALSQQAISFILKELEGEDPESEAEEAEREGES